jgi:hypothetical protein
VTGDRCGPLPCCIQTPPIQPPEAEPMSEHRSTPLRVAVLLLMALLLPAGCSAIAGIKPSQETAEKFLTHMQAGDGTAAYQCCSASCKAVATQKDIQGLWDAIEEGRGKVKDWTCEATHFTAGTAGSSVALTYRLNCDQGECIVRFVLVPEAERWLVQGLNYQLGPHRESPEKPPAADPLQPKNSEI